MRYLEVSDDGRVVVDGLAVHCFPHALAVEGELLHGLLLRKVRPLVEELPGRLVLEPGHVEKARRGADVRRHDGAPSATPVGERERSVNIQTSCNKRDFTTNPGVMFRKRVMGDKVVCVFFFFN